MMTSSYIATTVSISACVEAHTQVECVVVRPYNDTSLIQLLRVFILQNNDRHGKQSLLVAFLLLGGIGCYITHGAVLYYRQVQVYVQYYHTTYSHHTSDNSSYIC
jgi:hypothetical protein